MLRPVVLVVCLGLLIGAGVFRAAGRASPHEQTSASLHGRKVTITYGRPFKKGREIFGGLVPWGQVWRLGADEATVLETEGELTVGTVKLPKGSYTLYVIPTDKEWTLVVNKKVKTWGAFDYDQKLDVGRATMTVSTAAGPVEQFTIAIESRGGKGTIKMSWDKTVATIDILCPAAH